MPAFATDLVPIGICHVLNIACTCNEPQQDNWQEPRCGDCCQLGAVLGGTVRKCGAAGDTFIMLAARARPDGGSLSPCPPRGCKHYERKRIAVWRTTANASPPYLCD
eukprot:365271-Chlamydomonas_euryale.AAC.3